MLQPVDPALFFFARTRFCTSTTVTVGEGWLPWARFRGEKSGVKLHVRLDLANDALAETSLARVHDSAMAPQLLSTPTNRDRSRPELCGF